MNEHHTWSASHNPVDQHHLKFIKISKSVNEKGSKFNFLKKNSQNSLVGIFFSKVQQVILLLNCENNSLCSHLLYSLAYTLQFHCFYLLRKVQTSLLLPIYAFFFFKQFSALFILLWLIDVLFYRTKEQILLENSLQLPINWT